MWGIQKTHNLTKEYAYRLRILNYQTVLFQSKPLCYVHQGGLFDTKRRDGSVIKHSSSSGQGDLEGDVINLTASSNEIFLSGGLYCDSISTILISHSSEMMSTSSKLTDDMDTTTTKKAGSRTRQIYGLHLSIVCKCY